jgi:hypothetical protein
VALNGRGQPLDLEDAMVLNYIDKSGSRIHGPPYTKAQEAEFYRRVGRGPITVARPADRKEPTSPAPEQQVTKDY